MFHPLEICILSWDDVPFVGVNQHSRLFGFQYEMSGVESRLEGSPVLILQKTSSPPHHLSAAPASWQHPEVQEGHGQRV